MDEGKECLYLIAVCNVRVLQPLPSPMQQETEYLLEFDLRHLSEQVWRILYARIIVYQNPNISGDTLGPAAVP